MDLLWRCRLYYMNLLGFFKCTRSGSQEILHVFMLIMVNYCKTDSYLFDNHQLTKCHDHHSPTPEHAILIWRGIDTTHFSAYITVASHPSPSPTRSKSSYCMAPLRSQEHLGCSLERFGLLTSVLFQSWSDWSKDTISETNIRIMMPV